jgi:hypothetical protein
VFIAATPEEVFSCLTDPLRYVQWMGSQATLEAVPGVFHLHMADGFEAAGTVVEVAPPHRSQLVISSSGPAIGGAGANGTDGATGIAGGPGGNGGNATDDGAEPLLCEN